MHQHPITPPHRYTQGHLHGICSETLSNQHFQTCLWWQCHASAGPRTGQAAVRTEGGMSTMRIGHLPNSCLACACVCAVFRHAPEAGMRATTRVVAGNSSAHFIFAVIMAGDYKVQKSYSTTVFYRNLCPCSLLPVIPCPSRALHWVNRSPCMRHKFSARPQAPG